MNANLWKGIRKTAITPMPQLLTELKKQGEGGTWLLIKEAKPKRVLAQE